MLPWKTVDRGEPPALLLQEFVTEEVGIESCRMDGKREFPFLPLIPRPVMICKSAFVSVLPDP